MKSLRNTFILGSLVVGLCAIQSGTAFADFEGFGADIPLEQATKMIIPNDYAVSYGSGVDTSVEVSWNSASSWKKALMGAVSKKGLTAEFEGNTVQIAKSTSKSTSRPYSSTPSKEMVQKKSSSNSTKNKTSTYSPRVSTSAQEVGGGGFVIRPYNKTSSGSNSGLTMSGKNIYGKDGWKNYSGKGQFIVESGYMLHGTLNTWAEATGWKVVWNSDHDYLIEASATFNGTFVEATKALIGAMRDARPQISVDYYNGNKVMVVSNSLSDVVNR